VKFFDEHTLAGVGFGLVVPWFDRLDVAIAFGVTATIAWTVAAFCLWRDQ
jgi:hypothetical protein